MKRSFSEFRTQRELGAKDLPKVMKKCTDALKHLKATVRRNRRATSDCSVCNSALQIAMDFEVSWLLEHEESARGGVLVRLCRALTPSCCLGL